MMQTRMMTWDGEKYVVRMRGPEEHEARIAHDLPGEWSNEGRSDRFPEGWWVVPSLVFVSMVWGGLLVLVVQGVLG